MKRLLCVLAILAFAAFGMRGAFMMPMGHMHGAHAMNHLEPTEPTCPMGFVCPLAFSHFGDDILAPSAIAFVSALLGAVAGLALAVAIGRAYRSPLAVRANDGPLVILKTAKRE